MLPSSSYCRQLFELLKEFQTCEFGKTSFDGKKKKKINNFAKIGFELKGAKGSLLRFLSMGGVMQIFGLLCQTLSLPH